MSVEVKLKIIVMAEQNLRAITNNPPEEPEEHGDQYNEWERMRNFMQFRRQEIQEMVQQQQVRLMRQQQHQSPCCSTSSSGKTVFKSIVPEF